MTTITYAADDTALLIVDPYNDFSGVDLLRAGGEQPFGERQAEPAAGARDERDGTLDLSYIRA